MNILLRILGLFFLAVGAVGAVLPVLPTVPFVLLAAACFVRSSPRLHAMLADSRTFGPMIRRWNSQRCVSAKVKVVAITMVVISGGCSVVFLIQATWGRVLAGVLIAVGIAVVLTLRTCPRAPDNT